MGSAAYIGRVGGLAVALGVGTAIATGHGIATAEGTDSSGSSSSSSSSTGSTDSASSTAGTAADGDSSPSGADTRDTDIGTDKDTDDASDDSEDPDDTDSDSGIAEPADTAQDSDDTAGRPQQTVTKKPRGVRQAGRPTTATPSEPRTPVAEPEPAPAATPAAQTATPVTEPTLKAADPSDTLATADTVAVFAAARTLATATVTENPTRPAARQSAHPLTGVVKVVSNVLDWAAGVVPGSPASPTLAWTLLAFARREVDSLLARLDPSHIVNNSATDTSARALAAAALNPRPNFPPRGYQFSSSTSFVDWVTGNFAPNDTFNRYGIWGTDIGTMWDNGIPDDPNTPINENQVLIAFGDTFGGPNMTGTWRLNTLFRSPDRNLADGMAVPGGQWLNGNMFGGSPLWEEHYARQIILPERLPRGLPTGVTLIPTAGISVPTPGTQFGATQYVSFMSVKQWGAAGSWSTNYSAIAYSEDNGENWYISPTSVRNNFGGNSKFQQAALIRPGDGFVYSYGTPNGRQGQAYISRVAEADILDVTKYEYYSKGSKGGFFGIGAYKAGWYRNDPAKASAIFGRETGACGVGKAGNQVSEMSVQYNKTLGKYVALHGDQFNNVILRTSDRPEGGWSAPTVLMGQQGGGIYAPMMHPWSPSTLGTGTDLYFNLSVWNDYNVWLVKTDLTKL
ncbi:DUF4185 domain-containing protein [Mycobacterium sp. NPDC003323]